MKQWAQIILSFSLFLQRKISAELKHQLDNAAPKLTEVDIVLQGSDTEVHPWHQFSWLKRSVCVCVFRPRKMSFSLQLVLLKLCKCVETSFQDLCGVYPE